MNFTNPVISGFHPDPSICRVGEDFYLVTSSFEYFPGVPIFHSKNLIQWEQIGHVLNRESQLPLKGRYPEEWRGSAGVYAPTIRYHNERFYVITTNISTNKNFYVWTEKPEGPWSDPIIIEGWGGIDPSLLFDEDGTVYLSGTSQMDEQVGIYQAELDIDTGKLLTERRLVWQGTGGNDAEAPHLYEINGQYYLMIAEGGTEYGHMVTIARSESPYGPFISNPNNPILSNRSTNKPIQATGHADLVQAADGSWWAVFLGIRPIGYPRRHHLGRETNLAAIQWTEDGWPVIGANGRAEVDNETSSLILESTELWKQREEFDSDTLSPVWNFYRNPQPGSWSLTERPGWLTLNGQSCTLNDSDSPAFIGRRQQHFNCKISTLLDFIPQSEGEEAGLTVFMNENYHYEIARIYKNGKSSIIFRRKIGSLWKVEAEIDYIDPTVIFGINANEHIYEFTFTSLNGETIKIGSGECAMLATEVAGGFTGVLFGMYATGNGIVSNAPAHFDYFEYVPDEDM